MSSGSGASPGGKAVRSSTNNRAATSQQKLFSQDGSQARLREGNGTKPGAASASAGDSFESDARALMSFAVPLHSSSDSLGFGALSAMGNSFSALGGHALAQSVDFAVEPLVNRALSPLIEGRKEPEYQHIRGRLHADQEGRPSPFRLEGKDSDSTPTSQGLDIAATTRSPFQSAAVASTSSSEGASPTERQRSGSLSPSGSFQSFSSSPKADAGASDQQSTLRGRIQKERRPSGVVFIRRLGGSSSSKSLSSMSSSGDLASQVGPPARGSADSPRQGDSAATPRATAAESAHTPAKEHSVSPAASNAQVLEIHEQLRSFTPTSAAEGAQRPSTNMAVPQYPSLKTSRGIQETQSPEAGISERQVFLPDALPEGQLKASDYPSPGSSNSNGQRSHDSQPDHFHLGKAGALLTATWQSQEPAMWPSGFSSTEDDTEAEKRARVQTDKGARKGMRVGRHRKTLSISRKFAGGSDGEAQLYRSDGAQRPGARSSAEGFSPPAPRSSTHSPRVQSDTNARLKRAVSSNTRRTPGMPPISPLRVHADVRSASLSSADGGPASLSRAVTVSTPVVKDIWKAVAAAKVSATPTARNEPSGKAKESWAPVAAVGASFSSFLRMWSPVGPTRAASASTESTVQVLGEPPSPGARGQPQLTGPGNKEAAGSATPKAGDDAENMAVLRCKSSHGECVVFLVGTAHVSKDSCEEVRKVVRMVKPDVVFLEICQDRVAMLLPQEDLQVPSFSELLKALREKRANAFSVLYSWMLAKVADKVDVLPGAEFRAAYEEAAACGAMVKLGDRPVQVTIRRTWALLSPWHKVKLVAMLVLQALWLPSKSELENLVEQLKQADVLSAAVEELGQQFPSLVQTLIHERDLFMAAVLRQVAQRSSAVVAVVGKGHLKGIEENWENSNIDVKSLLVVPPEQPFLSPTAKKWVAVTFVGATTAALYCTIRYYKRKSLS